MFIRTDLLTAILLLNLTACATMPADITTLMFDELPAAPIDSISINGVTFSYDGSFSNYNGFSGPITAELLDRPHLDVRTDGEVTLDFAHYTPVLEFAISYRNANTFDEAASVQLFDADLQPITTIVVGTSPLVTFTEGEFSYSGTPVKRAVISLDMSINDFAHIDNLTFKSK